jgi:hypothetical protein
MFNEDLSRHQDSEFMMRAQKSGIDIIFQDNFISNYMISPSEFKSRVRQGRISLTFCNNFIVNNKIFFNKKAEIGYLTNISLRICLLQGLNPFKIIFSILKLGGFFYLVKQIILKLMFKLKN